MTEVNSLVEAFRCKFVSPHKWWYELASLCDGSSASTMASQRETMLLGRGVLWRRQPTDGEGGERGYGLHKLYENSLGLA